MIDLIKISKELNIEHLLLRDVKKLFAISVDKIITPVSLDEDEDIEYNIYFGYQESGQVLEDIKEMLNKEFDGYSLTHMEGYWMGIKESSARVMILGNINDLQKVEDICKKINHIANQESVLLVIDKVSASDFITERVLIKAQAYNISS